MTVDGVGVVGGFPSSHAVKTSSSAIIASIGGDEGDLWRAVERRSRWVMAMVGQTCEMESIVVETCGDEKRSWC